MRLRRLDLTRYGKFTDRVIDFGPGESGASDLHIIYGLNEAGKSTTFAAYLDLLFGIPERSPYNYLHPYSTMQIGARLEFDGGEHELVRLKQRSGSLVDAGGQPVNEAMLSAALGGIGRDAYRTMFSLDDQSLEDGGNAIMQSRGELGELLFQASSGLAGLSRSLVAAAEDAAAIYRKRSSGTQLAELKRTLTALKAQRDEVDTFAYAYQALATSHAQAEASYNATMSELAEARIRHTEMNRILGALPLTGDLSRLTAALAAQGDMLRPPSEWFTLLPQLSRDETRLQALLESAQRNIDLLTEEIESMTVDETVLAVASRITALEDGRARYRTAESDLPRRRIAIVAEEAVITAILAELEQQGHPSPADLLLPASLTATIRELIETRSGIDERLRSTESELKRTEAAHERLREEARAEFADEDETSPDAAARIEKALARLNGSDLPARLVVEERTAAQLRRDHQAKLAALAPWSGDPDLLASMRSAEPRQIEAWRAQANAIDKRTAEYQAKHRELITEQKQAQARIAAFQAQGPIDDSVAQRVRRERDGAWQDHLARLDHETAGAFEEHLHRDDALSAERLARAQELAELRQLTQSLAAIKAGIARQQELLAEAAAESAALAEKLRAFVPDMLITEAEPTELLAVLESWSARRGQALAAGDMLQQAEEAVRHIRADLARQATALTDALEAVGAAPAGELPVAELIEAAREFLARQKGRQAARAAHAKNLASLNRDLAERERDRGEAVAAAQAWQNDWQHALAKTWFADKADSLPAVRAILKVLANLPAALREHDQMAQRITTMERDQEQFRTDLAAVIAALGETLDQTDPLLAAEALLARCNDALRARQILTDRQTDLERLTANRRALDEEIAVHNARKSELTIFFEAETLTAVGQHLEQARERERMETRIADLRQQITASLRVAMYEDAEQMLSGIDAADIERQAAELSARIDDLTERARLLFVEATRARDKLDAVGGDDAVARIEAQRRTIFLDIEDRAIRYLKLRAGISAAEQALHLYREKHRSSMMKRASEAFRLITGGNYSGLATRPDKDREILIGVASDGTSKLAEAMSTGTQFQLYLALRLAGYEEFATVRPSVPFIADDIMESFDNPRSEEVFRLLGEMAKVGQVIYLTHHWHLCEIAKQVVPGVRVHELS